MKKIAIILALCIAPIALAQANETPDSKLSKVQKKKVLKKFDRDGDGKLNEQERAKAKEAIKARREAN